MTDTPVRKKRKKNERKTARRNVTICAIAAFVIVAVTIAALVIFGGSAPSSAVIKIPANATTEQLHDSISKYLGDSYADKVTRLVKFRGTNIRQRHGAYLIEAGWSPLNAMRRITSGPQHPVTITINGFRLPESLQEKVAAKFDFSADSLAKVMADEKTMQKYGLTPSQSMALFFNDSYDFFWNASPETIIEKVGSHYLDVWNKERCDKASALGLTPADVMIIASITDEETNAKEEKGTIGRLYVNRLKSGMPLQADPTVRYAIGDFSIKRVTIPMTRTPNTYNTYMNKGLPPGPIRTTSVETVDAILNSQPHEFLYMCAKEDFSGRHSFAKTYAEHQQNARRYKRELDRRGIR